MANQKVKEVLIAKEKEAATEAKQKEDLTEMEKEASLIITAVDHTGAVTTEGDHLKAMTKEVVHTEARTDLLVPHTDQSTIHMESAKSVTVPTAAAMEVVHMKTVDKDRTEEKANRKTIEKMRIYPSTVL